MWLGYILLLALAVVSSSKQPIKRQIPYQIPQELPLIRPQGRNPQGFKPSPIDQDAHEDIDRNSVQPAPFYPRLQQGVQFVRQEPAGKQQDYQQIQQGKKSLDRKPLKGEELDLEEEEKEEPDRLTILLPQSKFSCSGKNTGYYADEGLKCEVFHYCQDNARHSWICPEGFLFHQVHLICMPPSVDNICSTSSQFHFVNDFLYKPINAEEAQTKPNVTLRYSDRYYPENYYDEEFRTVLLHQNQQQHHQQQLQHQSDEHQLYSPKPSVQPQYRQANQVFHSPEEVNIPLQQRRPIATGAPNRHVFQGQGSEEYEY
uniref:Secreted Chitin binding peritrophin-like protein n=1 Tax=Pristhesancus plagipennis TaxID=1955184 RepID=A0A2K8JMG3_PRIPG|nr:secreted Chitin binding peritrophin-like protein [Pristhesancus plagipennis]